MSVILLLDRKGIKSAVSLIYGDVSDVVTLEITRGNCKVSISSESGTSGDITFIYTLEDERAGTASIKPLYSTGGIGGTYSNGTKGSSGDEITNLTTSIEGISHTFVWNSVTDLGKDYRGTIYFKIWSYDRDNHIGDYMESETVKIQINNAPAVPVISSPTTGYFDKDETPTIVFNIPACVPPDSYSDLHFKIEIADNSDFTSNLVTFESRNKQTGWQYWDDSIWITIPASGIPVVLDHTLVGNDARLTIQSEDNLTPGYKYIRVSAGGITS